MRTTVAPAAPADDKGKTDKKGKNSPPKDDKPEDKPKVDPKDVEDAAARRRGRETENDGRADDGVRTTSNVGARDVAIAALKEKQAELREDKKEIREDIQDLEEEINNDEGTAGAVGTVVDVVTSPITAVAGLFGRSNPVSDAVEGAAEHVLGLEDDKKELEQKEDDLAAQEAEIAAEIEKLEDERTLNFLADVAHVTKMPNAVVDVIEGSDGLEISVESDSPSGSDAAYSSEHKTIMITEEILDQAEADLAVLRAAGIADADGNIIDAERFNSGIEVTIGDGDIPNRGLLAQSQRVDTAADSAIGKASLFLHEIIHGSQDTEHKIAEVRAQGFALIEEARQTARETGQDPHALVAAATREAEMLRIDALEYDAYVGQETIELQSGKEKQGFVTINPDGSLLPRRDAVENIYNFQIGKPLLHGENAGQVFGGGVQDDDHGHDHDHENEHDNGRRPVVPPGIFGRIFGSLFDGVTPGRWTPTDETGRWTPTDETGRWTPTWATGRWTPTDETGRWTPTDETGRWTPTDETGRWTPTDETGRWTPTDETGRWTPTDETGRWTPTDETGRWTPTDETGRWTPTDETGRWTPTDETGRWTPGSEITGPFDTDPYDDHNEPLGPKYLP